MTEVKPDPFASFDLTGRSALITGGSRGLGRVMAETFARAGANVVIASRKAEACEQAAKDISEATGRSVVGVGCHVGDWEALDGLVKQAIDTHGPIDILVNNAGMSPLYDSVVNVGEALWDKVLDVNLKGPFRLACLVGDHMQEHRGGSIINISSIAAVRPTSDVVPYSAAKAGLNAMSIGLAHAFGPTVRVNAIMAGPFLTDISKAWSEQTIKTAFLSSALGRAGEPSEIAGAALYLASDASSFTTGSVMTVDGGRP